MHDKMHVANKYLNFKIYYKNTGIAKKLKGTCQEVSVFYYSYS